MALRALRGLAPAAVLLLLLAACSDPACPDGTVRDPSAPDPKTARCLEADAGPDAPDTSPDAPPPDAGPCNGLCAPDLCIADTCVECSPTTPCTEGVCTAEGACVTCTQDAHCTSADAARCDLDTNECAPCEASPQCEGVTAGDRPLGVCDGGTCVECTEASAETTCGMNACDPVGKTCTGTRRNSLTECRACLSDTECTAGLRCIPLTYEGAARGHYCLPLPPAGGCGLPANRPFAVDLAARVSRSGAAAATYCGINEALTTCEAVLATLEGEGAGCDPEAVVSACPEGGRCAPVGPSGTNLCTYPCSNQNQCPSDPVVLATCTAGGDRYCGRTP